MSTRRGDSPSVESRPNGVEAAIVAGADEAFPLVLGLDTFADRTSHEDL